MLFDTQAQLSRLPQLLAAVVDAPNAIHCMHAAAAVALSQWF
jgi:hypothetical protein